MIEAGRLRHRVRLQVPEKSQDTTTGEIRIGWADIAVDVPAAIEPMSVGKILAAQQVQSEVTTLITLRWRPGLHSDLRVVHGSVIYDVIGYVPDKNSGRSYVTLPCKAGVNEID